MTSETGKKTGGVKNGLYAARLKPLPEKVVDC